MSNIKLTLLSPVHIGNGNNYNKEIDFKKNPYIYDDTCKQNFIEIISSSKLFKLILQKSDSDAQIDFQYPKITYLINQFAININDIIKYKLRTSTKNIKNEIVQQIKSVNLNPIIPGSSIKGALRSVILWNYVKNIMSTQARNNLYDDLLDDRKNNNYVVKDLLKVVFGNDSNFNTMRFLLVGDSVEFSNDSLCVYETNIATIKEKDNLKFCEKTLGIFAEYIDKNALSYFRLKIVDNNIPNSIKQRLESINSLEKIFKICNEYALDFVRSELEHFKLMNLKNDNKIIDFYNSLELKIQDNIKNNNIKCLLHLGWGSGWKGITGNWLSNDMEEVWEIIINSRFLQRKHASSKFHYYPKSRKIILQAGELSLASGWMELDRDADDFIKNFISNKKVESSISVKSISKTEKTDKTEMKIKTDVKTEIPETKTEPDVKTEIVEMEIEPDVKTENIEKTETQTENLLSPIEKLIAGIQNHFLENEIIDIYFKIDGYEEADKKLIANAIKEYFIKEKKWSKKDCSKKQRIKVKKIKDILGES